MILVLSTAQSLYWLGRIAVRIDNLCHLLPFEDDEAARSYAHAFALPAWSADTLNQLLLDPDQTVSLPGNLQHLFENVQQVRGVILEQTYQAFNALQQTDIEPEPAFIDRKRSANQTVSSPAEDLISAQAEAPRELSLQLNPDIRLRLAQCMDVMREEDDRVQLFWKLGQIIESVDIALRVQSTPLTAIQGLADILDELEALGWQGLDAAFHHFQQRPGLTGLYQLCDLLDELFEDGP